MENLIELLKFKLKLLKKNSSEEELLELEKKYLKAYNDFLKKENISSFDQVNITKYREDIKVLKSLIKKIIKIEKNDKKMNRRQIDAYKKYK